MIMKNPIKTLTRLLNRNPSNDLISLLYTKAMNQPLFIHPALGEMVIQGYLNATPDQMAGDPGSRGSNTGQGSIGVIDISGALVAHETVGPSGSGPLSYEEIGNGFDAMMEDPNLNVIIGRFDTPGGAASQNMDLSDKIFNARGKGKRLIAMIDDRAYSAGFALASAFDEIWVTRTSGVGSVGVVSYHVDQSGLNEKNGVKIEYIYAGEKKIAGNPHEALTEEAREEFQMEVDRLYDMFTETVARNLGMSVEGVKRTEAGSFYGNSAVKAGFAHKVGTFNELLASLSEEEINNVGVNNMANQSDFKPDYKYDPYTGQEIIRKPKYDAFTGELLSENTGDENDEESGNEADGGNENTGSDTGNEDAGSNGGNESADGDAGSESDSDEAGDGESAQAVLQAEADQVKTESTIRALCAAAHAPESADDFIKSGMDVNEIKQELSSFRAGNESAIINTAKPKIVAQEKAEASQGWGKAFKQAMR